MHPPKKSMLDQAPDNPLVHGIHIIASTFFFFMATPIAVWIVLTFIVPSITSFLDAGKDTQHTDKYISYLASVRLAEGRSAQIFNYNFGITEDAWPFRYADRLARTMTPEENGSMIADAESGKRAMAEARSEQPNQNGEVEHRQRDKEITGKISSWLDDRFWPIQARILGYGLPRAIYAGYILVLGLPAILVGWFIGQYSARLRVRSNQAPMGLRHRFYKYLMHSCFTSIPLVVMIPVAMPSPLVIFMFTILGAALLILVRRHFVEI